MNILREKYLLFTICLLLIGFSTNAQSVSDTFSFDLKKFKGKGPYEFVKETSKNTGLTSQLSLPVGEWIYTDSNEIIRVKGTYKVKSKLSYRAGKWEYFDYEGEPLFDEIYGSSKVTYNFYKPCTIISGEGFEIIDFNDDGVLERTHHNKPMPPVDLQIKKTTETFLGELTYDSLVAIDKRNPNTSILVKEGARPIDKDRNLVPNWSFENWDEDNLMSGVEMENHIGDWIASAGTPDIYKSKRFYALDGYAAVGCRFHSTGMSHIEFISCGLNSWLEKDSTYCIKVYVRLRENSAYAVNALGVLLSKKIPSHNDLISGSQKPSIKHHGGSMLNYKTRWMELSCIYKSKGDEQYLTLGSFAASDSMQRQLMGGHAQESYYFFDNIQVYKVSNPSECPCNIGTNDEPPPPPPVVKRKFIVRNIFFENDKWDLLPESFDALDSLYNVIESEGFKKIVISGHTSNTGSRERNTKLSMKRAEAVMQYLVTQGLPKTMFECKGFGPDQPISDNTTPEGQAENRRVEFEIIE